ncbi:GNAT family N-acetyltransferase [Mycoplasmatota bacterium WC44]
MNFTVRKETEKDAEQMGYVHYNAWIETYTDKIHSNYLDKLSLKRSIDMFTSIKCSNHIVILVENKIIGFIGYSKARDKDLSDEYGEIPGMYILEKYHRKGFGRILLKEAVNELKKDGYRKINLWVLDSNINAISFYENYGFIYEGKSKIEIRTEPLKELRFIYNISEE